MEKTRRIDKVEDIMVKDIIRLNQIFLALFGCTDDKLFSQVEKLLGCKIERRIDGISFTDIDNHDEGIEWIEGLDV